MAYQKAAKDERKEFLQKTFVNIALWIWQK
jgi:hypothetical protein